MRETETNSEKGFTEDLTWRLTGEVSGWFCLDGGIQVLGDIVSIG